MSIFDNMLELNNSFLLIALIIIAVICIYLLYSNLTKSGETASLKSGLTALIQQNKKRDEIINFLLERIENLEHNTVVPSAALVGTEPPQANVFVSNDVNPTHGDIDDILSAVNVEKSQVATSNEVLDILESMDDEPETEPVQQSHETKNIDAPSAELPTHEDEQHQQTVHVPPSLKLSYTPKGCDNETFEVALGCKRILEKDERSKSALNPTVINIEDEQHQQTVHVITIEDEQHQQTVPEIHIKEMHSEFQDLESEFDDLMMEQNEPAPVNNDLVSALLDADEESLAGDHEFDLSTVPKSKDKLNAQYTVKQLKALSRQLKLKSKGNKTELINRICEKLN